ncbi:MAG: glutamate synthase-related protein [Methanomicrobiaceae archaeon]|nr:glutamate synthase-related protein [Methanomicrobiaceae archaeon]
MVRYRCNVCHVFEYDNQRGDSVTGVPPGTEPAEFPDDWKCPICSSDRTHLERLKTEKEAVTATQEVTCPVCGATHTISVSHIGMEEMAKYLGKWERYSDELEVHMAHIRKISSTGASIIEPMRTTLPVPSWDEILFLGAQLARLPLNPDEPVSTRTVIGPGAARPMVIDTPIYVTQMSFGALSREVKMALARGSAANRTAIGSGEGGILPEEREAAYRHIFEYVPNRYSVTEENLRSADAIEIKVGQSSKPGMGALLPAEKVTEEIAAIRGFSPGHDIESPARFPDIRTPADLAARVRWLREQSGGRPIGIKIAAGHLEGDLAVAFEATLTSSPSTGGREGPRHRRSS